MVHSCCNPFAIPGHESSSRRKSLRIVQEWMVEKVPHISLQSRICDYCRKKFVNYQPPIPEPVPETAEQQIPELSSTSPDSEGSDSESQHINRGEAVASLNVCLANLGETPYSQVKGRGKGYCRQKVDKLTEALKRTGIASETVKDDGEEMIELLKEKFRTTTQKGEQLQILSVLPKSWSLKKLQEEFCVTSYMARQSKTLVKEKGILSLPDPKRGPSLPLQTVQLVCEFYQSDEVSRVMPGKKDFVSVKEQGNRIHVQKRLMLGNLKEVYHEFKGQFPNEKIGFSRFLHFDQSNAC